MRSFVIFSICLLSQNALAGTYIDVGIGYAIRMDQSSGESCLRDWKKESNEWGCSSNPLGYAAIGYEHKGFELSIEHWSSIAEYDAGINIASIKYRHKFK